MSVVHVVVPRDGDDAVIELVELDRDAGVWGGSRVGVPDAFGTVTEVLAALSSRPGDDPWAGEVASALDRERGWGIPGGWRRPVLEVFRGRGLMFHATASANRESVRLHGLDWRRMGAAPGIAGSTCPELPAVFVCDSRDDVSFFLGMARTLADVWAVDAAGLWVESGPNGWWIISQPVGPERLALAERDAARPGELSCPVTAERRPRTGNDAQITGQRRPGRITWRTVTATVNGTARDHLACFGWYWSLPPKNG